MAESATLACWTGTLPVLAPQSRAGGASGQSAVALRARVMKYQVYHPGPVTSTSKYYSRYCEFICYLFVVMNNV